MKFVLWIVGALVGLFILLWMNAIRATISRTRRLNKQIGPVVTAVAEGHENASELVLACAKDPATRNHLYARLKDMGMAETFPGEYRTIEKIAESDLVRWLMHPNELQIAPGEIELLRQLDVTDEQKCGRCFLFRFRVEAPHWAADRGWMSGIAGPFWDGDPAPDAGRETFSELTSYDAMTDCEHVEFLKAAAKKRGLVMPS